MSGRLENKVCLITGAGSGIGAACARRFAREGASLMLADVNADAVAAIASELQGGGVQAESSTLDVSNRQQVEEVVARTVEWGGALHVAVNSAGISRRNVAPGADFEEAWDQVINVNLKGTLLVSHAAVEAMRGGGGAIVNLGSIMSVIGYPADSGLSDGFNPYSHSKGGVAQMTRDMGVQLAREGIRVNAVCPGFVRTSLTTAISENNALHQKFCERQPIGRMGEPEEIANVILFLASDEASFVTAATWMVDGGYTAN